MNEVKYAQVEIEMEGEDKPFLALFNKTNNGEIHLHKVYKLDVDYELDWYENNLHQAYIHNKDSKPDNKKTTYSFLHGWLVYTFA